MPSLDPLQRHDRTLRFIQQEMGWAASPSREDLLQIASELEVTVRLPDAGDERQLHLSALAIANVVGRLPIGAMKFLVDQAPLRIQAAPYRGPTVTRALDELTGRLGIATTITPLGGGGDLGAVIATPSDSTSWEMAVDGSAAYLGRNPQGSTATYDPLGAYALASMLGGEVIRTWTRAAATAGLGDPGPRFRARTAPATDGWLNVYPWKTASPSRAASLPSVDWVSCGAVNQGILAILAASPNIHISGTVFDPGILDLPDLNRSLLSFPDTLDQPKARAGAEALSADICWQVGPYPEALRGLRSSWIVCGTDDPSVRPRCQTLWPDRLIVSATENVFGYAAWHSADTPDSFCAGCQPATDLPTQEPIPTTGPTSLATALAAAAIIRGLATDETPPHRLDLLTLRLDSPLAMERSEPPPWPGCTICSTKRASHSPMAMGFNSPPEQGVVG